MQTRTCKHMHAHIYAHTHTHIHMHAHTHARTHIHAHTCTHLDARKHRVKLVRLLCMRKHPCVCVRTHTQACNGTCAHIYAHARRDRMNASSDAQSLYAKTVCACSSPFFFFLCSFFFCFSVSHRLRTHTSYGFHTRVSHASSILRVFLHFAIHIFRIHRFFCFVFSAGPRIQGEHDVHIDIEQHSHKTGASEFE